jgi:hypothetical protein
MKKHLPALLISMLLLLPMQLTRAQISLQDNKTPTELYAQVKNFDEFINRFNYEKDFRNEPVTNAFKSKYSRKQIIESLFDQYDIRTDTTNSENKQFLSLKNRFIENAITNNYQIKKDTNLYAMVSSSFLFKGAMVPVELILKYTFDGDNAFRWTITDVFSQALSISDEFNLEYYISPNSDDLDFLNLNKVFAPNCHTINLTEPGFRYNQLHIFLYLVETGQLIFKQTNSMSYLYTGIMGYKLSIKEFNRPGYNSGWLISNIQEL